MYVEAIWTGHCVVCQEEGSEIPRCPKDRPSRLGDPRAVYERFLENIAKFRDLKITSSR